MQTLSGVLHFNLYAEQGTVIGIASTAHHCIGSCKKTPADMCIQCHQPSSSCLLSDPTVLLSRRRGAESKLSDAELQIEALESKLTSLSQLLESEQAAAESALKASEQAWQTRVAEATAAAAHDTRDTADREFRALHANLARQLDESKAAYEVSRETASKLLASMFVHFMPKWCSQLTDGW